MSGVYICVCVVCMYMCMYVWRGVSVWCKYMCVCDVCLCMFWWGVCVLCIYVGGVCLYMGWWVVVAWVMSVYVCVWIACMSECMCVIV